MSRLEIQTQEWDSLRQKLLALPQELQATILTEAATEVGIYISGVAKDTYPPTPRRRCFESPMFSSIEG